jgi:hypothetical protein
MSRSKSQVYRPSERASNLLKTQWEEKGEDGSVPALTLGAADFEPAVMSGHDFLTHPEAKAISRGSFGCEERVEDILSHRGVNAGAVVSDAEDEALTARGPISSLTTSDEKSAAKRHGLKRVADEVVEHLANISLKADGRFATPKLLLHLNARIAEPAFVNTHHRRKQIGTCGRLWL